jgi:hypothetical protein
MKYTNMGARSQFPDIRSSAHLFGSGLWTKASKLCSLKIQTYSGIAQWLSALGRIFYAKSSGCRYINPTGRAPER